MYVHVYGAIMGTLISEELEELSELISNTGRKRRKCAITDRH